MAETREVMKSFWTSQAKNADVKEMFLDTDGEKIQLQERPEVLGLLPDLTGKRVLELACGIGRFTGHLAERAKHVTTVDFVEKYVAKNREMNQSFTNITYIVDDVMNLSFDKDSFDIIFSNWLLMYCNVEEIKRLLQRLLNWSTVDTYIFFREACFGQIGNFSLSGNPSFYRVPTELNRLFRQVSLRRPDEEKDCNLEIIFARHLLSMIKLKDNRGTICWLLQKRQGGTSNQGEDVNTSDMQISKEVINAGITEEQTHIKKLDLQPGQTVLHVGCGDGKLDFYMESEYGVLVHGLDKSCKLIEAAWETKGKEKDRKISFEIGDIKERPFPAQHFDVIYMSKTNATEKDMTNIVERFVTWLKPGGKILVSVLGVQDTEQCTITKAFPDILEMTYRHYDKYQTCWCIAENILA